MNCPIASDQLIAVAPRSLGITKQTRFDELFNSPWVLNPDGCGYRSLLVSHAWSVHKSVHVIAEAQGAGLQRELVVSGLGTGLVPEEVARTWMLRYPDSQALVIVRPAKKQFVIAAALISTKRASRLRRPIELLGIGVDRGFRGPAVKDQSALVFARQIGPFDSEQTSMRAAKTARKPNWRGASAACSRLSESLRPLIRSSCSAS